MLNVSVRIFHDDMSPHIMQMTSMNVSDANNDADEDEDDERYNASALHGHGHGGFGNIWGVRRKY
jgi:hypothetical protein